MRKGIVYSELEVIKITIGEYVLSFYLEKSGRIHSWYIDKNSYYISSEQMNEGWQCSYLDWWHYSPALSSEEQRCLVRVPRQTLSDSRLTSVNIRFTMNSYRSLSKIGVIGYGLRDETVSGNCWLWFLFSYILLKWSAQLVCWLEWWRLTFSLVTFGWNSVRALLCGRSGSKRKYGDYLEHLSYGEERIKTDD